MAIRYFFFFENMQTNMLVYFTITTLVMYFGPENIMPSLGQSFNNVPVINAPIGYLSGFNMFSKNGRNIHAYQGIPYAVPPVNELRFKKTKRLKGKGWEGVFAANKRPTPCVQMNPIGIFYSTKGDEDCLKLNVYVPEVDTEKKLPVMVWFHGGGFTSGDSSDQVYSPGYLLDKDVILVTVNYRLGIFGYFTLGNDDAPGNLGAWDQRESLVWVQNNIAAFGGNPKKVTIFGESAGGISVSYQLASRKSKGLFHAAIIQSGPIHLPGLTVDKSRPLPDIHAEFAEEIGCPLNNDDIDKTMTCLQSKPAPELMAGYRMFDNCHILPDFIPMAYPLVWTAYDDSHVVMDPFFADNPRRLFERGQFNSVPTMIGITKDEGLIQSTQFLKHPELFHNFMNNWDECVASNILAKFFIKGPLPTDLKTKVDKLQQFYFGQSLAKELNNDLLTNFTAAFSDGFLFGTDLMARHLSSKAKTFYYHLDHLGSFSVSDVFLSKPHELVWQHAKKVFGIHDTSNLGVCHGDDLLYLFSPSIPVQRFGNDEDEKMVDFMVDLWTNFATYHNPTPDDKSWPAFGINGQTYVRLDHSKIIKETDPERDNRLLFVQKNLV